MIDDEVPKVRNAVAWVYLRLIENVYQMVFTSSDTLSLYIQKALNHITDHHRITTLILSSL